MIDRERLSKLIWLKLRRKSRKLIPKQEKEVAIKRLHRELWLDATWNTNYIVFTISACMIATFGLISNSTAVIIGAMLVAPLMLPLRALAFAALDGDYSLFRKALLSIIGATIVALLLSSITGHIINIPEFGSETLARTQPTLVDLGIAVVAGGISSFAKVRKGVSDAIAGTAIAVALMPPLCVVGLSLSQSKFYFARGAFLLYLTNLLGITLACMIVFVLAGYTQVSHALGWTFALTSLMLIPLGASFLELVRQAQLEVEISNKLINETITVGEEVHNTKIDVDWTKSPPIIYVHLETEKEIYPNQAALVAEFIERKMGEPFEIVFIVSEVEHVTSREPFESEKKSTFATIAENLLGEEDDRVIRRDTSPASAVVIEQNRTFLIKSTIITTEEFINQNSYSIYDEKIFSRRHLNYYEPTKLNPVPKRSAN
ncbi:MAG: TIGR00341 family protein [Cyanobacteria bacterium P01_G01_bin.67]